MDGDEQNPSYQPSREGKELQGERMGQTKASSAQVKKKI